MRSFPLLPLIAAALLAAAPVRAATAFDNFGPDDGFDTGSSALVGPGPTGTVELGFAFTAAVTGSLSALTAPFASSAPPSVTNFNLYAWDGTTRGDRIDLSPARVGNPQGAPGLVVANQWHTSLTAGVQYLVTATATTASYWSTALDSTSGSLIYFLDGAPGRIDGAQVAARVGVGLSDPAPVPLPGAMPLLLGGLAALALATRRHGSRRA
ncbi:MAG: hypothetical protein U1E59_01490 [Amaricoccus sp.]